MTEKYHFNAANVDPSVPEIGAGIDPNNFVRKIDSGEGSVTFSYNPNDKIANTIGHLGGLFTHIMLGVPETSFKKPTVELVHELAERWKNVPWKGDVLVRVGYANLYEDIRRSLSPANDMRNSWPRLLRIIGLPATVYYSLKGGLSRENYYNPRSKIVTIYNPNIAIGMHEIGHAKFDDEHDPWVQAAMGFLQLVPGFIMYPEWQASKRAMANLASDEERKKAMKVLEPAFSTYAAGIPLLHFGADHIEHGLGTLLGIGKRSDPIRRRALKELTKYTMQALSTIPGHITSRLPGRKSSFGYIFEGKKSNQEEPIHVRYGTGKADTISKEV